MRILIVQRSLSPPGGGNAVAAWMVHALCGRHEVATLTERRWSAVDTDAFYGTSIAGHPVEQYTAPLPWRLLSPVPEERMTRLRMSALLGRSRQLASRFDMMITADNFAVFARPGIQYVHFPARLQPPPARLDALVRWYFALCNRVMGADWSGAAANLTLTNSRWSAEGLERLGEVSPPVVLYPPVLDPGEGLPWRDRDDVFLCIGRFTAAKRIELAMAIVRAARAQSIQHARLIVVGSPVDAEYTSRLRGIAGAESWIEFRENLSRADLNRLMGRSRFGIQPMVGEHFGMATAEMTRAGCLVFAHRSGGTPEVLNQEHALLWTTEAEAVARIAALPPADGLRARLRRNAGQFSTENFVGRFRTIVEGVQVS
jgi:glycosyltransferase involved in cell wall biosynthesis